MAANPDASRSLDELWVELTTGERRAIGDQVASHTGPGLLTALTTGIQLIHRLKLNHTLGETQPGQVVSGDGPSHRGQLLPEEPDPTTAVHMQEQGERGTVEQGAQESHAAQPLTFSETNERRRFQKYVLGPQASEQPSNNTSTPTDLRNIGIPSARVLGGLPSTTPGLLGNDQAANGTTALIGGTANNTSKSGPFEISDSSDEAASFFSKDRAGFSFGKQNVQAASSPNTGGRFGTNPNAGALSGSLERQDPTSQTTEVPSTKQANTYGASKRPRYEDQGMGNSQKRPRLDESAHMQQGKGVLWNTTANASGSTSGQAASFGNGQSQPLDYAGSSAIDATGTDSAGAGCAPMTVGSSSVLRGSLVAASSSTTDTSLPAAAAQPSTENPASKDPGTPPDSTQEYFKPYKVRDVCAGFGVDAFLNAHVTRQNIGNFSQEEMRLADYGRGMRFGSFPSSPPKTRGPQSRTAK